MGAMSPASPAPPAAESRVDGAALEGVSLARVLDALERRGIALDDAATWHLGRRIAGELARAHAVTDEEGSPAPVLHRRLCPSTIYLTLEGEVTLAAGPAGDAEEREPDEGRYMAPEQRSGGRVTHRADVYRLGLLLWSMLSGRPPPANGLRPPGLASFRADLPAELVAAIGAALEPAAAKRTITCVEIEQWLAPMDKGDSGRRALAGYARLVEGEGKAEQEVIEEPPLTAPNAEGPPLQRSPGPPIAPAPPEMVRPDPRSRRLSPLQSIGVAAITAALVIAVGTYIGDRVARVPAAAPSSGALGP